MKKIIFIIAVLFIAFIATSYEELIRGRTEIEDLYPIVLAGIDKNSEPKNNYLITTVSPTTEEEATKPNNVMTATGETAFEANRLIGVYAENDIFWGNARYLLIGEEASKEDIFKYLDFFMRDNEPRMTISPIIVKGMSSQKLLGLLYEQNIDISKSVDSVIQNYNLMSFSSTLNLGEVINLMSETQDGYLPFIDMKIETKNIKIEQGSEEVQKGELKEVLIGGSSTPKNVDYVIHSPGYALIKDGKVVEYLINEQGRGLNWIINKVVSGVIVIENEGVKYNLEILQGNSKVVPTIEGNTLQAEIKVKVNTSITEMNKSNISIDDKLIQVLQKKLGKVVEKEVTDTIDIVQKLEIDVLGIGEKFRHKYPVKWEKKYKDKWEELFPNLNIKVTVEPNIGRSARFYESIFFKEGK